MGKKTLINLILLILSGSLFLSAVYLYISNRGDDMILYSWLGIDCHNGLFEYLRQHAWHPANWVIYNLPDGLWLLSYLLAMESLWGDDKRLKWMFCIPVIFFAFMMEWLQYVGKFPGTGDVLDIVFYTKAILIFLLTIKLKQMAYEGN